jgi:hypothetical protein
MKLSDRQAAREREAHNEEIGAVSEIFEDNLRRESNG